MFGTLTAIGLLASFLFKPGKAISAVIAVEQYTRHQGYRLGEGPFTERPDGIGIYIEAASKSNIGSTLAALQEYRPELKKFEGLLLQATQSEADDLWELLQPVRHIIGKFSGTAAMMIEAQQELQEETSSVPFQTYMEEMGFIQDWVNWLMEGIAELDQAEVMAELEGARTLAADLRLQHDIDAIEGRMHHAKAKIQYVEAIKTVLDTDLASVLGPVLLWLERFPSARMTKPSASVLPLLVQERLACA